MKSTKKTTMASNNGSASSTDLQELYSAISGVIGKKCWKVQFVYGGNLSLHFGRHMPCVSPRMRGKKKGEWLLETLGTGWTMFTPRGVIVSSEYDEHRLERKLRVLEGRKVTRINLTVPDHSLTISFGEDYLFQLTPTANDTKSEVPYWEFFLSGHRLITFGPGNVWLCTRSDEFWESLMRQTGTESPAQAAHDLRKLAGLE